MVAIDISGLTTFVPVFGFLLVFVVVYALLGKTKVLGENKFVHLLISFAISIIFLVSAQAIKFVEFTVPFIAIFIISLVFVGLIVGVIKGNIEEFFQPAFGWLIVVVIIIFFVFSAIHVFGVAMSEYAPAQFVLQPQVLGIIILCAVAFIASWLLTRK